MRVLVSSRVRGEPAVQNFTFSPGKPTGWFKPGDIGCPCHDPAEATASVASPPPPPQVTTGPPATLPVLSTTPPPLPHRTAEGLNLLPVGELPPIPTAPGAPAAAAT